MPTFSETFIRLTANGTIWNGSDIWSIGLNIAGAGGPTVAPTQAQADAARDAWVKFMRPPVATDGIVGTAAVLTHVKAARIGTDGKYVDPAPTVSTVPNGVTAAGGGSNMHAPQVALAVTLLGPNPRGAAGRGRIYIPNISMPIGTDGRLSSADALKAANLVSDLIDALNPIFDGFVSIVGSSTETGRGPASQVVEQVRCGRVLDTIRSRRSKFPEEPVAATRLVDTAIGAP